MITENMKAWGLVFANSLKKWTDDGYSYTFAALSASADADATFPLEKAEIVEIRRMAKENRLPELLD